MTGGLVADIGIGPISIPTPGDVVTALKNAVLEVADAVFDKIVEWIAGLLAEAVTKVTEALVTLLSAIRPTLTPGGAVEHAAPIQQSVAGLAAMLVTIFFVFRIIHGLITGQAGANLRATLVDLPMVIVGTLFFGFLCYTLLSVVDAFSDPLITEYASTLNDTVGRLYSQDGIVQGGIFVILFALLYIIAAVFLCFELFVRSSLIYLVVMFAPLAIATRVWGPTRSYARRATETAVALIFSKLAIAVTLATGASLMAGAADDGGNVAMIQGSAILLLAAFMPFGLMRVIPLMEGAIAAEGIAKAMGTKAVGGAVVAGGGVKLATAGAAKLKPGSSGSGATTSTGSGAAPTSGAGPGGTDPGGSAPTPVAPTAPSGSGAGATAGPSTSPAAGASPPSSGGAGRASSGTTSAGATTPAGTTNSSPATAPAESNTEANPATTPVASAPTGRAAPSRSVTDQPDRSTATTGTPTTVTPTTSATAASTSTATGQAGPRKIGTPPLKRRNAASTASRSSASPTRPASTDGPGVSAAPSSPAAATPPAPTPPVPSVPLAKSRTINRPTPKGPTPKPPTTTTTEETSP